MTEASFASLNPTLLARKGGAKPAMRPQLHVLPDTLDEQSVDSEQLEDLGWNDMGAESEEMPAHKAEVLPLTPAKTVSEPQIVPVAGNDEGSEAEVAEPKRGHAKAARTSGRRAAFTLRLDSDRHLKLRLAATMHGKSAQVLVTEALDQMLSQIDNLDALVDRMKQTGKPTQNRSDAN